MSTAKFNTWLNPDGTQNYKCRAWVNFNGTGTVAIRASGNVTSITDNGTGDYTVNFTTALPDANYSPVTATYYAYNGTVWNSTIRNSVLMAITTNSCRVGTGYSYSSGQAAEDLEQVYVAIFR